MAIIREAWLDGHDLNPENIISDITYGKYMVRGGSAVGFIKDIPVIITWHDNYMRINFVLCSKVKEVLDEVNKTAAMIMESSGNKYIDVSHFQNIIWLKTYWKIKE